MLIIVIASTKKKTNQSIGVSKLEMSTLLSNFKRRPLSALNISVYYLGDGFKSIFRSQIVTGDILAC